MWRTSEEITDKILNLAASITNQVFGSELVIKKDKLNKKGHEVNELLKNKCRIRQLSFIDNKNIILGILNESGIHLNEYGTSRHVNNFCFRMNAWRDETCMGARNKTQKEESPIVKRVNKNFVFHVNSSNSDRPINPTVDSIKPLSRNKSAGERTENYIFASITAQRLQNAKNVITGALNVNSKFSAGADYK